MGRIMNHDISVQSKIVQELFVEEYNLFVVWSEWLRIFPPSTACLHGGGGPQVGVVSCLGGVTRLSI